MDPTRPTVVDPAPRSAAEPDLPPPLSAQPMSWNLLDEPAFAQRYEIDATLGSGGMGVVRLCTDRRFGRQVALKTLLPGAADSDPAAITRFLREAHVQGQLEHPAIVPIHDVGRAPGGNAYFTMKRIRGETLAAVLVRLREGDEAAARRYTRRRLLTAFSTVCLAVHLAHVRGVVHRDLKPANVIFGDFGEVYVLDWGIAKVRGEPSVGTTGPEAAAIASGSDAGTAAGSQLGTPGYMAPEQARGEPDVDGRADVFALGATLFELLTLRHLVPKGKPAEMIAATLRGVDGSPRGRVPEAEIPPELDDLCVRATALDPRDRLESAQALSEAIERFLDGDRDLERRREHARTHAEASRRAAESALAGDDARRAEAIREAGRALALDASNEVAAATITSLMAQPPRATPEAVREDIRAAHLADRRSSLAGASAGIAVQMAMLTLGAMWLGVRDWRMVGAIVGLGVLSVVVMAVGRRSGSLGWRVATTVVPQLLVASTGWLFGPLLMMPMLVFNATLAQLAGLMRFRAPVLFILPVATLVIWPLLELAGVLPPSYVFAHDQLRIQARAVAFDAVPATTYLVALNVAALIACAAVFIRKQRELLTTDLRLRILLWHLRWLVPQDHA